MILKIALLIICAVLNWWGGYSWHNARRFIMSSLIAGYCAWQIATWWTFFPIVIPFMLCLSLQDDNRGLWCFLCAVSASSFLFFFGHIHLIAWIAYCLGNGLIGWVVNDKLKLNQFWNDVIEGPGLALVIFLL